MIYKSAIRFRAGTQPCQELIDEGVVTTEDLLAYIARVSNPDNQINSQTAPKLLNYCMKKKHWSVFEQADLTYEIKTTRDIGRQILRHRSSTFQEFSQRYAEVSVDLELRKEPRLQDNKNRQSSIKLEGTDANLLKIWEESQKKVLIEAKMAYDQALSMGIAKEVARVVLPEGLTPSVMYMKNNIRNWIHYCDVRTDPGTQLEHREIAEMISADMAERFPFYKMYLAAPEREQWLFAERVAQRYQDEIDALKLVNEKLQEEKSNLSWKIDQSRFT